MQKLLQKVLVVLSIVVMISPAGPLPATPRTQSL